MGNKQTRQYRMFIRTFITGWFGGLLWSFFAVILYYFNFIEISPRSYLLRSWSVSDWTSTWKGTLIAIFMASIISVGIAFIYGLLFKKVNSIWMGIAFGLMLWLVFVLMTQYAFPNIKPFTDFDKESIVSSVCIFVLYGTFTGYAISFDYYETYILKTKRVANN